MTRRRFAFWIGFALFSLAEQLRVHGLDKIAAAILPDTKRSIGTSPPPLPEHWVLANNRTWWWYRRENWIDGQWKLTGITTPIHNESGKPLVSGKGYLESSLVPKEVRTPQESTPSVVSQESTQQHKQGHEQGQADPVRRARHGRPPSKWLRSLEAEELRIWLKTIDVPEADVSGMTFWTHLTRDHAFDPEKIEGLTLAEQGQLHAAAHYGY